MSLKYPVSTLLSLVIICCTGCRKEVSDFTYTKPDLPVFHSILRVGGPIEATLSTVAYLSDTSFAPLAGTDVALYIDGILSGKMEENLPGKYSTNIAAEPFKVYQYKITSGRYGLMTVTDTMPGTPVIHSIKHTNISGVDEEGVTVPGVTIDFSTAEEGVHYVYIRLRTIQHGNDRDCEILDIDDPLLLQEGLPIPLFKLASQKPGRYQLNLKYTTGSSNSSSTFLYPLIVEFSFVSRNYYEYLKSVHFYEKGRFSQGIGVVNTPYNLYSNVEGGLGIVGCTNTVRLDTIFP